MRYYKLICIELGVSVLGTPLMLEREQLELYGDEKTTRFDIFSSQIEKFTLLFGSGYWILADHLYDYVKKYNLLIEKGFLFAISMETSQVNRNMILKNYEQNL
ncbi:MAG: hypothetical protein PHF46_02750, partial [Candidatus Gracilibacteria bacterium]|nr:hypothetical protein [Candidatus Gracilibacteria bacterium]MDD3120302.1 hypothetical protein [Candidatus Gracilibacteria bacterium]